MAALQAQLSSTPKTTAPKVTVFNAVVELIRDNLPTEVLVETKSPQKRGKGEASGVFEPQSDPILQLPWHEYAIRAFEGCAHKVSHPATRPRVRSRLSGW